jgi:hypothetical protein
LLPKTRQEFPDRLRQAWAEPLSFFGILAAAAAFWRLSASPGGVRIGDAGGGGFGDWRTLLFLAADFASAVCATIVVAFGTWRFRPTLRTRAYAVALGCLLLWLIASAYSRNHFGVALTPQYARLGLRWFAQRAPTTSEWISLGLIVQLLGIPVAIRLWYALSRDLARRWHSHHAALPARRMPVVTAGALSFFLLVETLPTLVPRHARYPGAADGIWLSTVTAFFAAPKHDPFSGPSLSASHLMAEWEELVQGENPAALQLPTLAEPSVRVPRHIVIVELETAPVELYHIARDTSLPTLFELAQTSIVGIQHHTTSLATTWAVYSMLTGLYSLPGRPISCYGHIDDASSLPAALAAAGYETTFIDSFRTDWAGGDWNSRMLRELGFQHVVDGSLPDGIHPGGAFEFFEAIERHSFAQAATAIVDAASRRRRALVFVSTSLGHFPLSERSKTPHASPEAQAHDVAAAIDSSLSNLLGMVDRAGLRDSLIVVVTGDHGLRFPSEFSSANRPVVFGDLSNRVPFVLHVPGLVTHQVAIPFPTSHVDIAPTLLDLVGVRQPPGALYHGRSLFDWPTGGRWSFTWNTDLAPADFAYGPTGDYSIDRTTRSVLDSHGARAADGESIQSLTDKASRLIDQSAGVLLREGERRRGPPDARDVCFGA